MSKDGIRVDEFDIYALGAERVSYALKNIHTLALEVTQGNIGLLSLELQVELLYDADGPYFIIAAARGPENEPEEDRKLTIKPGCWIVILWDELHMFRDAEFRSTFSFDGLEAMKEYAKKDVAATENLFKPNERKLDPLRDYRKKPEETEAFLAKADPYKPQGDQPTTIAPAVGEVKVWDPIRDEIQQGSLDDPNKPDIAL